MGLKEELVPRSLRHLQLGGCKLYQRRKPKEFEAMRIKRREFLEKSIAGVGGVLLGSRWALGETAPLKKVDPFETVSLGKTDVKMSRFCLGTGMRGGNRESNHTRMGKQKFETLIRGSHDRGIK